MIRLISFSLTYIFIANSLSATEEKPPPPDEPPPMATLSIIALGPKPMRRFTTSAKPQSSSNADHALPATHRQKVLLAPPLHATPPPLLFFQANQQGKDWSSLDIGFNNQTALKKIAANKTVKLHKSIPMDSSEETPITLPALTSDSANLLFLTTSTRPTVRWDKKLMATHIPLTWSHLGATRIILFNASSQTTAIHLADHKAFSLKPMSKTIIDLPSSAQAKTISLKAKGMRDTQISIQDTMRVHPHITKVYAFYDALPQTNGGRTLGSFRAVYKKPPL